MLTRADELAVTAVPPNVCQPVMSTVDCAVATLPMAKAATAAIGEMRVRNPFMSISEIVEWMESGCRAVDRAVLRTNDGRPRAEARGGPTS